MKFNLAFIVILLLTPCLYSDQEDKEAIITAANTYHNKPCRENRKMLKEKINRYKLRCEFSPDANAWHSHVYYLDKTNDNIVEQSTMIIMPYTQEIQNTPNIPLALFLMYYNGYINCGIGYVGHAVDKHRTSPWWNESLKGICANQKEALARLCTYWARRITDTGDIPHGVKSEKMKEWADREYTDEECEQVWVQFVENVTSRALGFKMNAAYIYSINEAAREEQRKALEKARAAAERSSKRTAVVLDSFCDGNNTLEKITGALVELARLKAPVESPMPNYGKIAKAAGKAEADLIDAYYQAYMAKKAEAILARTAAMDQRDERVLMLKYYCQSGLNRPRKEIIATLDSILKLNPQNDRALKLKLYLETEYGGK